MSTEILVTCGTAGHAVLSLLSVCDRSSLSRVRASSVFSTKDGKVNSYDFALGSHAHPGWAFSKEGRYRADFTHTFDGRSVKASLHFAVGKTPLPAIQDCGDNPIGTKQARP